MKLLQSIFLSLIFSSGGFFMKWLDKLERKYGRYAIRNLMYYIIILYGIGFVLQVVMPDLYSRWLALDAYAILHGQIWRIVTFIIAPPNSSFFWIFFSLYLYYLIGGALEGTWGAFRFNLYFFSGVLLHVLGCLLAYLIFGYSLSYGVYYLNMSLFLAYAAEYPEHTLMIMGIIPIKCKVLGWIDGAYFAIAILAGFMLPFGSASWMALVQVGIVALPSNSIAALLSLLNFLIFFFISRGRRFSPKEVKRRKTYEKRIRVASARSGHHRCAVCGRTEKDGDDLEFRFCSKCVGNYEYCQDHLFTHEHRK